MVGHSHLLAIWDTYMHKEHAHIHVGHYQNVFKSAPYPIASYAMLLLHESRKKLTTCYSIVGEHPSMTTEDFQIFATPLKARSEKRDPLRLLPT